MKFRPVIPDGDDENLNVDRIDMKESEISHGLLGHTKDVIDRLKRNEKKYPEDERWPKLQERYKEIEQSLEEKGARDSRGQKESQS